VRVRTPEAARLRDLLTGSGTDVTNVQPDLLEVTGLDGAEIGRVACREAIPLEELTPVQASLEQAFMELTDDALEYRVTPAAERHAS
jgi:ABC-2 type transport system ATP-binding protein